MSKKNGRLKRIDDSLYQEIQRLKAEFNIGDVEASKRIAQAFKRKGKKITVDDLFDFR